MSALAGIWNFDGKPNAGQVCAQMLKAQAVYGTHDESQWDAGTVAMGRRLHRGLPEDIHDNQPQAAGDGRFIMVADVRLDNRDDLIRELGQSSSEARLLADSALLMGAWERWQERCFERLVGDYAFALWDQAQQRLTLARDPLGSRPLHFHRGSSFFAFSSMPKGLHTLPEIPRVPNEERMAEFLALLPESGPETFFQNVERVEGGCFLTVSRNGTTSRRHWEPKQQLVKLAGAEEYAEAMREHLDRAVRARLRGAGNIVASHLSSGFDSSAVASSAALEMTKRGGKVVAFTAVPREGYDGPSPRSRTGDEGPIAARTAAMHRNMEHVRISTNGRSPLLDLDRNFFIFERPVLNLCNSVWSKAILDAARARKIDVLLTGQMGNMSISYDGTTLLPQLLRRGHFFKWARAGSAIVRNGNMRLAGMLSVSFGPYTPVPIWRLLNKVMRNRDVGLETYSALNPKRLTQLNLEARARERNLDLTYRPRGNGFESRLWVLRRVDFGNYNKGILAGWGIEQRDPTADRRLIEFCLNVPEEQFLVDGDTKSLARRAFAGRIAPEAIGQRHKGYQAVDWHEGLTAAREDLQAELTRLSECGPAVDAIDLIRLKSLVENWPAGGWEQSEVTQHYRLALLRGVSSGHFLRRASGSNA